ncbi:MAG: tRNA lysidine(34) synthetase TilS [Weeksellaceae bacterium]|jgi:tRNA(Ile)-lysidine synthase|nr:tRNA lysidine(34) synthetase TilS [Weeksellaceae bacterium]
MNNFLTKFHQNWNLPTNKSFLVAVSGGVDSMVLCDILLKNSISFSIAHCNFQLRGKDSEEDVKFVENFCQQNSIPFFTKKFDVPAAKQNENSSTQMIARKLRYEWFFELMKVYHFDFLLTAHHLNDSLETFFINLSRGSGIEGLSGIKSSSNSIFRPLLSFSKEEILHYAQEFKIQWREDSSNQETNYIRNKVRHKISPVLNELHPDFLQNFAKSLHYLQTDNQILHQYIAELQKKIFQKEEGIFHISISELQKLRPLETYLFHLFSDFGFKFPLEINKLIHSENNGEIQSFSHRLVKNRKELLLFSKTIEDSSIETEINPNQIIKKPLYLKVSISEFRETSASEVLDAEKISFPLRLRKKRTGDIFYPLGLNGAKKLSKFFKDEKFSKIEKENTWLLIDNENRIICILGKRIDDRFKITKDTHKFLNIFLC